MAAFAFAGLTHDDIRDLVHLAGASYADNDAPDGWDVLTGPALHGNSVRTAETDLLLKQMPGDTYDVELENSSLDAAARVFVDTASDAPRIALSFRGTDDWVDFDGGDWRANLGLLLNGRYIENFEPLLDQVRVYAQRNGIDSSNIFVTGHSLGGAAANQLYQRDDIEDGFFQQSRFFTLATPLVAADKGTDNILNVAMDNDKVFAITHEVSEVLQEESKFDQLAVMVPSLSSVPMSFYTFFLESLAQEEGNFESATDNILSVFPPQAGVFSNPASEGFREEHSTTTYEYVVESIIDSFYYDITVRDDFIAVLMSPETNIATRVALGGAAEAERLFIVGNEHPNIVFAGSQELFVDGGSGLDEVRFSGAEADYALRQNADTSVDVIGVSDTTSGSTVQLYDVERLVFADTEIELPEPGFDGGTVRLSVASPTVDTVMFSIEAETTDGNVEFPVLPRNATAANAIVETQIDLVGNIIDFDFSQTNGEQFVSVPDGFNGYIFDDVENSLPPIVGVHIVGETTSLDLESGDIAFTKDRIAVNVESLTYEPTSTARLYVDFEVEREDDDGQWSLAGTTCDVEGEDTRGVTWNDTILVFTAEERVDGQLELEGYFDWASEEGSTGRERFEGELSAGGELALAGLVIEEGKSGNVVTGEYEAILTADGTRMSGTWGGADVIPGTWEATLVDDAMIA